MGELADDAVSGMSCSGCGIYFRQEHGYPVLCKSCWREWTPAEKRRSGLQRATEPEADEDLPPLEPSNAKRPERKKRGCCESRQGGPHAESCCNHPHNVGKGRAS